MEGDGRKPEAGPVEIAIGVDLLRRVIRDIDASGEVETDVLLADLLCASWPTPRTQSQ
jgi:hypothetical protein